MGIEYRDLPFWDRPDLTPYLIHFTKNTESEDDYSAFNNLVSILKKGEIWGSDITGYIKGNNEATCFMDIPFASLKYILNEENSSKENPRYEPYGIFIEKKLAYDEGVRPVLYLSNDEVVDIGIPKDELWRVVRLEVYRNDWVSWIHEREWRCKGNFILPKKKKVKKVVYPFKVGVLVKNYREVVKLQNMIEKNPDKFLIDISVILPLDIICQGLYI